MTVNTWKQHIVTLGWGNYVGYAYCSEDNYFHTWCLLKTFHRDWLDEISVHPDQEAAKAVVDDFKEKWEGGEFGSEDQVREFISSTQGVATSFALSEHAVNAILRQTELSN